jgi:hypothetical protein
MDKLTQQITTLLSEPGAELVLYGTKVGQPDWAEDILTNNPAHLLQAKAWAEANGFNRLRVYKVDLSRAPNFAVALNG